MANRKATKKSKKAMEQILGPAEELHEASEGVPSGVPTTVQVPGVSIGEILGGEKPVGDAAPAAPDVGIPLQKINDAAASVDFYKDADVQKHIDALHLPKKIASQIMDQIRNLHSIDEQINTGYISKIPDPEWESGKPFDVSNFHRGENIRDVILKRGVDPRNEQSAYLEDFKNANDPNYAELLDSARRIHPEWMKGYENVQKLKGDYQSAVDASGQSKDFIEKMKSGAYVRLKSGDVVPAKYVKDIQEKLRTIKDPIEKEMVSSALKNKMAQRLSEMESSRERGLIGQIGDTAGYTAGRVAGALADVGGQLVPKAVAGPLSTIAKPIGEWGSQFLENMGGPVGIGLGAAAAGGGILLGLKMRQDQIDKERMLSIESQARRDAMQMMHNQAVKARLQNDIANNLGRLQMQAPEIYMRVAAGRLLPQGAVVIGGTPRQDLLQQLGMSMSNGDFNQ